MALLTLCFLSIISSLYHKVNFLCVAKDFFFKRHSLCKMLSFPLVYFLMMLIRCSWLKCQERDCSTLSMFCHSRRPSALTKLYQSLTQQICRTLRGSLGALRDPERDAFLRWRDSTVQTTICYSFRKYARVQSHVVPGAESIKRGIFIKSL